MNDQACARFKFENARITRVKELAKVCFLHVYVQAGKYPDYHECVLFKLPDFPLVEGEAVNVSGEIQKRKPKDGSRDWTIELIARKVERGDDSKAPRPMERQTAPRSEPVASQGHPNDDDDLMF